MWQGFATLWQAFAIAENEKTLAGTSVKNLRDHVDSESSHGWPPHPIPSHVFPIIPPVGFYVISCRQNVPEKNGVLDVPVGAAVQTIRNFDAKMVVVAGLSFDDFKGQFSLPPEVFQVRGESLTRGGAER